MEEKGEEFSLPKDIIFEILKQLPVETLLRLRCVSKLWCSIIHDPVFIKSHHKHSHTRRGGVRILISHDNFDIYSVDPEIGSDIVHLLQLPRSEGWVRWGKYNSKDKIQCVNGLVCIRDRIWNPSTRVRIVIPPLKMREIMSAESLNSFLDSELEPPSLEYRYYPQYILGFDPSAQEYKILNKCLMVNMRGDEYCTRVQYKILTIGTSSWRDIDFYPDEGSSWRAFLYNFCCIAGVIYSLECWVEDYFILAFEVGSEKFRTMSLPQGMKVDSSYNLIQVRESLGIVDSLGKTLYILEDYENNLWYMPGFFPDHFEEPYRMLISLIGTIHTGEILVVRSGLKDGYVDWVYYDQECFTRRTVYPLSGEREGEERNKHTYAGKTSSPHVVRKLIEDSIRNRLLSMRFKDSRSSRNVAADWRVPSMVIWQ
ncbi:putative F-box protein At1g50870 [Cornus florida]|uniref:putative F-box protein At1g50870 n=1 Tax=Cornus florida TaxID=4283 RepID=UPI0028A0DBEF|nr:putative F-box protein At1g50870 [Cornus florida]